MADETSWRAGKTTAAQRGYGAKWQRLRLRFLRSNPLCVFCKALGRIASATVVDHKVPHHGDQALFWNEDNWQALCKPCHDREKRAIEAGRRVVPRGGNASGMPTDPRHHWNRGRDGS